MTRWLSVVGIGEDGFDALSPAARCLVESAEIVVGGDRHLAMLQIGATRTITWEMPLSRTVEKIASFEGRPVCVVATGDPLHYGIGAMLVRRFGIEALRIIPGQSAFSLACARLGWPLNETVQLTLHGRPVEKLNAHLVSGQRLVVLSNNASTPAQIAELLSAAGFGASRLHVFCHMGGKRERYLHGTATDGIHGDPDDLNTVAVEMKSDAHAPVCSSFPGMEDSAFDHDGQITRRDVRAVTVSALQPGPDSLLWDVGAGSGSVSIEWMRSAARSRAIAIERDGDRCTRIGENARRLGVPDLEVVHGSAPQSLSGLPRPNAVFVGGGLTGDQVAELCIENLFSGGMFVANAVTLESETILLDLFRNHGGELQRIAIASASPVGSFHGWRSHMPVTQWRFRKP